MMPSREVAAIRHGSHAESRQPKESALGSLYRRLYETLCGSHPNVRPWHFQWLAGYYLKKTIRSLAPTFQGRILDAGCGDKPYREYFTAASEYIGLDVTQGPAVDVVVTPSQRWPLPDASFDVVLSSQVLEHVEDLSLTLGEISRLAKPAGLVVLSFPFIYNEHGTPFDFQRFSAYRAAKLIRGFEVVHLERQGAIGSTITVLWLNWLEQSLNTNLVTRVLKAILLPLWIVMCFLANIAGLAIDRIDRTNAFYSNVLVILRKGSEQTVVAGRR